MTNPTTEQPAAPQDALYYRTDISPEELLAALEQLRSEAKNEIERLIGILDQIDPYFDERERQVDDVACDEDDDLEPSLGSFETTNQTKSWGTRFLMCNGVVDAELDDCDREPSLGSSEEHPNPLNMMWSGYSTRGSQVCWADGNTDGREGDNCDEREDVSEDEGADHDGREPSLGWTDEEASRGRTYAGSMGFRTDYELAPSTFTETARDRYKRFDRYVTNPDGRHVDAEHLFTGRRRLRNLSDQQRKLLAAKAR